MRTSNNFPKVCSTVLAALLLGAVTPTKAGLFYPAIGQSARTQEPARKILTAEDFAKEHVERGSCREEVTFAIAINPSLPPFFFQLIPDLNAKWTDEHPHAGTIAISKAGDPGQTQIIEVMSYRIEEWFIRTFNVEDINFDGYLDISVVNEIAGKWASFNYWLFDPASQRFITNTLTEDLSNIRALERNFDPKSKTVRVRHLRIEGVLSEIYKQERGRLILIETREKRRGSMGNWEIVTRRVIDGESKIIKVDSVLTAADFSKNSLERVSGLGGDETFVIEINPALPPFVFRLIPDRTANFPIGYLTPQHVGTIEISKQGVIGTIQKIEVTSHIPHLNWFAEYFKAQDINFDGYLDIAVPSDFGAKWMSYHYWQFDPGSEQFVTNRLTVQLGRLAANSFDWNPGSGTLHLGFLMNDQARIGETYKIENAHLTLIQTEERLKDCNGNFREVTSRIINGKRDGKDTLRLEPCNRLTQNIAGGQVHNYEIPLEAFQSLVLTIETGNIDLMITLIGPEGETLVRRELTCDQDSTKISLVAKTSGIYRAEVRPAKEHFDDGLYFIWLEKPHSIIRQRSVPYSRS